MPKIGIAISNFNKDITHNLLQGALHALEGGLPQIISEWHGGNYREKARELGLLEQIKADHSSGKITEEDTTQLMENEIGKLESFCQENLNNFRNELETSRLFVPGSFELPLAAKWLTDDKCVAVIALGAIIKGETSHDEHIANACAQGLMRVGLEHSIPIGFGVITADSMKQAEERSSLDVINSSAERKQGGKGASNKGYEAARAVMEVLIVKEWQEHSRNKTA